MSSLLRRALQNRPLVVRSAIAMAGGSFSRQVEGWREDLLSASAALEQGPCNARITVWLGRPYLAGVIRAS